MFCTTSRFAALSAFVLSATLLTAPAAIATPSAYLSWDPALQQSDKPASITGDAYLYLQLVDIPAQASIGFKLEWTPYDLAGPCYYLSQPAQPPAGYGWIEPESASDSLCSLGDFQYALHFEAGAPHRTIAFIVSGGNCDQRAASFCLTEVELRDSIGQCIPVDILGNATILGGNGDCPTAVLAANPNRLISGQTASIEVSGSGFAPGMSAALASDSGTVANGSVEVQSLSRARCTFSVPSAPGSADLVLSLPNGQSARLENAVTISTAAQQPESDPNSIIVWLRPARVSVTNSSPRPATPLNTSPTSTLAAAMASAGVTDLGLLTVSSLDDSPPDSTLLGIPHDLYVMHLSGVSPGTAISTLLADTADVMEASPNAYFHPNETIPNDAKFGEQWWLRNTGTLWPNTPGQGTAGMDAHVSKAWDLYLRSNPSSVRVGVMDTGVDYTRPDLAGRVEHGQSLTFSADNQQCTGNTGQDCDDPASHGTSVAGIIAAQGNGGGNQVAGINWNATIVDLDIVCVCPASAAGQQTVIPLDNIISAMNYLVSPFLSPNPPHIVNMSFGSIGYLPTRSLALLFRAAAARNILIVCSAGNDNGNFTQYPAGFVPYVISVGAFDTNGNPWDDRVIDWRALFSGQTPPSNGNDKGPNMFLLAPGGRFIQTLYKGAESYTIDPRNLASQGFGGTSASAPVASGVASMIAAIDHSGLTNEDLQWLLAKTATIPLGQPTPWTSATGWGRINADAALYAIRPGIRIQRLSATDGVAVADSTNISFRVASWEASTPGIPNAQYDATRYKVTFNVTFPQPYLSTPLFWIRQRESWGASRIPPPQVYDPNYPYIMSAADPSGMNLALIWNPSAVIEGVTATGATLSTYVYHLTSANGQSADYWWPAAPQAAQVAYTAIGIGQGTLNAQTPFPSTTTLVVQPSVVRASCDVTLFVAGEGATLDLLDVSGRVVHKFGNFGHGTGSLRWNRPTSGDRSVSPGVYFLRLKSAGQVAAKRVVLLR